jgi:phosphatidylglycerophosphate synthase
MSARSLWRIAFGRRVREAPDELREQVVTWANGLTLARAAIATTILLVAVVEQSHDLLLAGLAFSMVFDFLDGQVARRYERETVFGAQLDGIADRIATALVAAGIVSMDPGLPTAIAATAVWIQFGVVDQLLTSQFLRFGLWSPDHFYYLGKPHGERVWRWNWSAAAKLASNLPIVVLALGPPWAAFAMSAVLVAARLPCYRSIRALASELPETNGQIPIEREETLPSRLRTARPRGGMPSVARR